MTLTHSHDVLLVDDEPVFRESTRELIRQAGFACDAAPDVETAIQLVSVHGYRLVIADLHLPASSGMDLLSHLSQLERRPVAMIATGYPSLDTALRAIDMPVAAYLIKPLDIDDLLTRIRRVLETDPLSTRARLRRVIDSASAVPAERHPVWFDQTMLQVVDLLEQLSDAWHTRALADQACASPLQADGSADHRALDALLDRIESGRLEPDDLHRLRQAIDHQTRRPRER